MDGDGSGSGDVSSTATNQVPLAYPELPQPNAWPPMGPTENDAAVVQMFARAYGGLVLSRLPLGGPNMGRISAVFFETRVGGGTRGGDDSQNGDADDDADAGADDDDDGDDDAYGGFGFSFGAVPASGVAIACLPETTVGEGEGEGEARERGECAVCLEEYEAGDALRTMPCAHGFHERCIFGWLRASRLCPLCRFVLPAEDEDTAADVEVGRDDQGEGDDDDDDDGSDGGALE